MNSLRQNELAGKHSTKTRSRGNKSFFMLNSLEHEIPAAQKKLKYRQMKKLLALSLSDVVFIMLINV